MNSKTMKLVLASQSPRRVHLLREAGYSVEVIPSQAEEKCAQFHDIAEIVRENAQIKGKEVVRRLATQGRLFLEPSVLVAADTLVVMGEKVYGKPANLQQAETFQIELGGKLHQVYTGVFLHDLQTTREVTFHDVTDVMLKQRSRSEIHATFAKVNPMDKAGAYGYQDAQEIVERLKGSETNVIGLPMEKLSEVLARW